MKSWADGFQRINADLDAVSFFTDELLLKLVQGPPLPKVHSDRLVGELLFRLWLYADGDAAVFSDVAVQVIPRLILALFNDQVLPRRRQCEEVSALKVILSQRPEDSVFEWLHERVSVFRSAEGFVAVVDDSGTAFPIPFRVDTPIAAGECFRDSKGRGIENWETEAASLWTVIGRHRIIVDLDTTQIGGDSALAGGSFALAVLFAARYDGQCAYDPLQVLATGAISEGCVRAVSGLDAKAALARKMGARVFVAPSVKSLGFVGSGKVLGLTPGTLADEAVDLFHGALQEGGLVSLSLGRAMALVPWLLRTSSTGRMPVPQCRALAIRLMQSFRDLATEQMRAASDEIRGAELSLEVFMASLENHEGRTDDALARLSRLAKLSKNDRSASLVSAMATHVVSLCDMGQLEKAVKVGEQMLQVVSDNYRDLSREGLELRTRAHGVLGGQGLLQLAVRHASEEHALESLAHLRKAAECVDRLLEMYDIRTVDYRAWKGRGAVQIALWHSLWQPDSAEQAFQTARMSLAADDFSSADHLRRAVLLGAYRSWLSNPTKPVPQFLSDLEMPSVAAPHWVRATCLKYRGSLLAASGEMEAGSSDFHSAYELLRRDRSPLVRVIAWTVAVQARALLKNQARDPFVKAVDSEEPYLQSYLAGEGGIGHDGAGDMKLPKTLLRLVY